MNLKILGSVSPYPKGNCNCPGYLISDNNTLILLDCGNGALRLFDMNNLNRLKVIISHLHKDHYADLFSLAYATYVYHNLNLLDKRVEVYLPKANKLELLDYNFLTSLKQNYLRFIEYDEKNVITTKGMQVEFKRAKHDINTYYAKVKNDKNSIVYSADTGYSEDLIDFAKKSDILICESSFLSYQKKDNNNHLSAREAGIIARCADTKKLILTHFWPEVEKELYLQEAQKEFLNTEAAIDGKVFKIGGNYANRKRL